MISVEGGKRGYHHVKHNTVLETCGSQIRNLKFSRTFMILSHFAWYSTSVPFPFPLILDKTVIWIILLNVNLQICPDLGK